MKLLIRYTEIRTGVKKVNYLKANKELVTSSFNEMENRINKIEVINGKKLEWAISELIIFK